MVLDDDDGTRSLAGSQRARVVTVPEPGERVGRFVIRARLGEGGMGVVLAGHDPDLDRPVAIKLLRAGAEAPAYRARLLREAQALARLDHPNVVKVYDVGVDGERVFVAMELVAGTTLTQWVSAERRTWREVVGKFVAVGDGLAAVHRAGLIHRDFKPDNVLVDRTGRARVADFGLARLDGADSDATRDGHGARLTRTGAVMGTPGYMAPEQQWGSDVDARADQYSFCVALRAALTGSTLTTASTIGGSDDPAAAERVVAAREWAKLPRRVRAVVTRGLSYDAAERYPDMATLLSALRDTIGSRRARVAAVVATSVFAAGVVATSVGIAMSGGDGGGGVGVGSGQIVDVGTGMGMGKGAGSGSGSVAVAEPDAVAGAAAAPVAVPAPAPAAAPVPAPAPAPGSGAKPAPAVAADPDALPTTRESFGDETKNPQHPAKVVEANAAGGGTAPAENADRGRELARIIGKVGYQGLDLTKVRTDPEGLERAVREVLGRRTAKHGADSVEVEEASIVLAMILRFRGECDEVTTVVMNVLGRGHLPPRREVLDAMPRERARWLGRAHLQMGLCQAKAALRVGADKIKNAGMWLTDSNMFLAIADAGDVERAETQLVLGVLGFELGRPTAMAWIETAQTFGGSRIQKLVEPWRAAAGL